MAETREKSWLPSFGRRLGRRLTPRKQQLMQQALPKWQCSAPEGGQVMDLAALFGNSNPVWLEVGFGAGEHLEHLARYYPDINFIGAEPFINGVVRLVDGIETQGISNIRIIADDVRPLIEALPPGALQRVDVLFPDPWHKVKHHKRRIINTEFLSLLGGVLPEGGDLWLATDHYDYSCWMLEHILPHKDFYWTAKSFKDWQNPPADWHETRYETKRAKNGKEAVFLHFERR